MSRAAPCPRHLEIPKPGFGRRTPPALVSAPIMGLFGLGLGWRAAAVALWCDTGDRRVDPWREVRILFLFTLVAYLAKLGRRPST